MTDDDNDKDVRLQNDFRREKKKSKNRWKDSPGHLTERRRKSSGLYVNGQTSFTKLNKSRFCRTSLVSSHIFSVPVSLCPPPVPPSLWARCQVSFKSVSRHARPRRAHPPLPSPPLPDLPPVTGSGNTAHAACKSAEEPGV